MAGDVLENGAHPGKHQSQVFGELRPGRSIKTLAEVLDHVRPHRILACVAPGAGHKAAGMTDEAEAPTGVAQEGDLLPA